MSRPWSILSPVAAVLLWFSAAGGLFAQGYGLAERPVVAPYLNGKLPPAEASTTGWSAVDAFPHLSFDNPTFILAQPRSDRLCVGTQQGRVYTFVNDAATTEKTLLFDLSDVTQGAYDSGMMGLAFHPQFGQAGSPNRGYVYVSYSYSPAPVNDVNAPSTTPSYNRLSRFTVPDGSLTADRQSELVLINQYDRHLWHNGGGMFFGPEGFLYLTVGDEGDNNDPFDNGGRINRGLFSGVLRIDVDRDSTRSHPIRRQPQSGTTPPSGWPSSYTQHYFIPNDNPWIDSKGTLLEEFYAIGFRSPHRVTYDAATDRIWLGDVGQSSWEEIDLIEKGGNYQWSYREGSHAAAKPRPGTVLGVEKPPIFDYPHQNGYTAVIGGYVYRGTAHAAYLGGKYIFGDNGTSRIRALVYDGTNSPEVTELCTVPNGGTETTGLSTIGVDHNQELLMCTVGIGVKIYKLARTGGQDEPPALLSQTGAFTDLATLTPAAELIPYTVNTPLWSDHAVKRRWMSVPSDANVEFSAHGAWSFPEGTVFVKHFELPVNDSNPAVRKRLETRFLVHGRNGKFYGLTYKWRADNSDADLLPGSLEETISIATESGTREQVWSYPGRQDCMICHNANAGHVLGVRTSQMNGTFTYPASGNHDNQLRAWSHIGLFANPPIEGEIDTLPRSVPLSATAESPELRVRSYLDANCAHCHRPNGVRANFDARLETPLDLQGLIRGAANDHLGIPGAKIIVPNDLSRSLLYQRDNRVGPGQMPPLAKNVIDAEYISVLRQWIKNLSPSLAPPAMIGNSGEGGSTDTITDSTGSYINATLFPVLSSGRLMEIRAKVGAINGSYRCAIYGDNQGNIGNLLATTTTLTHPGAGWQTFPLTEPLTVATGRSYWLAIWSDDADARVHMQRGGTVKWGQYPFGDWPRTINFSGSSENSYCLYATGPGAVSEPPVGLVSGAFSWQPPVNAGSRYQVSGLPRGLEMDPVTGLIRGIPEVSGTFRVRITESIGRTSSTQSFSFIVAPFPAELVGNYAALIERNAEVNGGLGGYLSIRVSPSGILSGRLYTAAASYPVRERFKVVPDEDPVCDVTGGPVVLSMSLSRTTAELNGVAKVNQAEAALSGRRQMFFVVGRRDGRGIPLNISLQPAAPALGDPGQPQGNGWMRWTYARSGRVSGSGRLSDGSQLTVGGIAGADSKVRFRSVLHRGKGSILGAPILAQPKDAIRPDRADLMLTGNADWRKLAHQDDQDLSYPTINEALTLMGARHQLSSGLTLLGNADLANNARIEFTDGGLADAAQGAQVSQVFQLTTLNRAIFGNASANPCGVMVKFDTGNGTFSGSFRLNDAGGRRDVTFQGITVNQTGYGYFNLPPLPAQTIRTILSGGVTIRGQAPPGSP